MATEDALTLAKGGATDVALVMVDQSDNIWRFVTGSGTMTLTKNGTAANLTVSGTIYSGANQGVDDGYGFVVGDDSFTQHVISDGGGSTNVTPEMQVYGTAQADSTQLIGMWSATNAAAPMLAFLKSGNATPGSQTIVADDEYLGRIVFFADDGADYESAAAEIRAVVQGTPGAGDMPGSLEFYTTADAGETLTLVGTLNADQTSTWEGAMTVSAGGLTVTAGGLTVTAGGLIVTAGNLLATERIVEVLTATDVDTQNHTLTVANIAAGIVVHTSTTGGGTVTTDTALNIIAGSGILSALTANGQCVKCYYVNDGDQTVTFAGGTDVTVADTGNTVLINEAAVLLFRRDSSTTMTMYVVSS